MHNYSLRLTHVNVYGSQWGIYLSPALQLHAVYIKNPYFLLQVMQESISVLQVT